jgi:transcriptional regulator with XRE-family HTH domain
MDQGVGHEVKRLREERGWSQAKLAVEANMSVSGVSMIENGQRNLTTTTLAKLAGALGVEVADLFPKGQSRLPFDPSDNEEAREWHLVGYVHPWIRLLDSLSERREQAAAEGMFSLDTYMEVGETIENVQNAAYSLIEGLKRHQGLDALQGSIGHRFRQSLIRSADAEKAAALSALRIYGQDQFAHARKARQAVGQDNREADDSSAGQNTSSRGAG